MSKYNRLLEEQVRKFYPSVPGPELEPLLQAISQSYNAFERDRERIEQIMNHSSDELLAANKELRKANAELDRFVYSVSHDLRAPIASVLGLIQIAEKEEDPEIRQQYFSLMQTSLLRLDNFIHDIIDYSRNSRLEAKPEPIAFDELTEEVAASLRYMPNAHTITLIKEFDIEAPFYTDRMRLKMILTNLIGNAVRYHNPRHPSPYIRLNIKTCKHKLQLQVEDNGIGINKIHLPRIFEMFFRAHEESKGSGLGLYIVKETVKKLDGSIEVESMPGFGTTFKIILPNLKPQQQETGR